MKTKTKQKILKVFAICILFLGNSNLIAQNSQLSTQTVCVGNIEPYTLVDPVNGPPTSNYSYQWSTNGGIIVGGISVGDNIDIDWNTPGVYTVSVVATDIATNCENSPIDVVVTVEALANFPIVTNPSPICLNDPNPQMLASTDPLGNGNGVFNWYLDASLTTLLQANSATYTDPLPYPINNTYNYWVTEESSNGCEGSATLVSVIVTPLPLQPTLVGLPYEACFGLPNPLFTATSSTGASNFNWYDSDPSLALGNPALATGVDTYTSLESNPNTSPGYSYWVEEVVGSCTSPATSFVFSINPPPASPSVTPLTITICEGDTPNDFIVSSGGANGSYDWYDDITLTNNIGNGTPYTPTQINTGTYSYYVTETHPTNNCISAASSVDFIINNLPLQPSVNASPSAIICFGQTNPTFFAIQALGSSGTGDYNWYDSDPSIPGAILLSSGPSFTPTQTVVGIEDFFLTEINNITNCEGPALSFIFEIVNLPTAPVLVQNPVEICFNDLNPLISPSGSNLIWYDDALLTNQVATGASFTPPASASGNAISVTTYPYWVVDQPGNCTSLPLQIDLQINPLPTPGPIWHN